jgi:hypothetical protein
MLTILTALAMMAAAGDSPDAGEIHATPDAGEIHACPSSTDAGEIHKAGDTCVDSKGLIWTYDGVIWRSSEGVIWDTTDGVIW